MILIEKRKVYFILFFSFLFILAVSVWTYNIGTSAGLKSNSELILFLGFLFSSLQLFFSVFLLINGKKKQRDFFYIMEVIRSGGVFSEDKAKKIGNFGIELKEALAVAHDITSKKSLKIANLNGLLKTLVEFVKESVLIINLNGEIIAASPDAKKEIDFKPDLNLLDCFPNLSIKKAFQESSLTHLPVEQENKIIFFPVFSTIGDISYFLVDISKEATITKFIKSINYDSISETKKRAKRNFFKFFTD